MAVQSLQTDGAPLSLSNVGRPGNSSPDILTKGLKSLLKNQGLALLLTAALEAHHRGETSRFKEQIEKMQEEIDKLSGEDKTENSEAMKAALEEIIGNQNKKIGELEDKIKLLQPPIIHQHSATTKTEKVEENTENYFTWGEDMYQPSEQAGIIASKHMKKYLELTKDEKLPDTTEQEHKIWDQARLEADSGLTEIMESKSVTESERIIATLGYNFTNDYMIGIHGAKISSSVLSFINKASKQSLEVSAAPVGSIGQALIKACGSIYGQNIYCKVINRAGRKTMDEIQDSPKTSQDEKDIARFINSLMNCREGEKNIDLIGCDILNGSITAMKSMQSGPISYVYGKITQDVLKEELTPTVRYQLINQTFKSLNKKKSKLTKDETALVSLGKIISEGKSGITLENAAKSGKGAINTIVDCKATPLAPAVAKMVYNVWGEKVSWKAAEFALKEACKVIMENYDAASKEYITAQSALNFEGSGLSYENTVQAKYNILKALLQ
jgi:hypothetical protein